MFEYPELKKGLPDPTLLIDTATSNFAVLFRRLLRHGALFCTEQSAPNLQHDDRWILFNDLVYDACITAGWVFSSASDSPDIIKISFSSPFHQCWFSNHLVPHRPEADFEDPLDLVCKVTARFSPSLPREPPVYF